jgi:flagellin-like hook-associated protein FlgL
VDDFELASQTLNAARGQVGAFGKRLVSTSNILNIKTESLPLSKSGHANTDLAEEVSNLKQGLLRFETFIRSLASQLQNKQS